VVPEARHRDIGEAMNHSPVYFVAWEAHDAHQWNVVSSKCRACHPALLRIVWGRR
jgi:hypothetical protein